MTSERIFAPQARIESQPIHDFVKSASLGTLTTSHPPASYPGQSFVLETATGHQLVTSNGVSWMVQAPPELSGSNTTRRYTLIRFSGSDYYGELNYQADDQLYHLPSGADPAKTDYRGESAILLALDGSDAQIRQGEALLVGETFRFNGADPVTFTGLLNREKARNGDEIQVFSISGVTVTWCNNGNAARDIWDDKTEYNTIATGGPAIAYTADGNQWQSTTDNNTGNTPSDASAFWDRVAATTQANQWQSFAIADSPITLTHDAKAVINATGSTTLAPLIVNVDMPPLMASQEGEITISDIVGGGTWGTGFIEFRFRDPAAGNAPVVTTVQDTFSASNTIADGIVQFDSQNLGGLDVKFRYFSNTATADVRYTTPTDVREIAVGATIVDPAIYKEWHDTSAGGKPIAKVFNADSGGWEAI